MRRRAAGAVEKYSERQRAGGYERQPRSAAGGVSGAGGLFTVVFQAVGRGDTTVAVSAVSLTGANGQAMGANTPPPLAVSVK